MKWFGKTLQNLTTFNYVGQKKKKKYMQCKFNKIRNRDKEATKLDDL